MTGGRFPIDTIRWIPFRNDAGAEIPAHAILRPTGVVLRGTTPTLTVAKPSTTLSGEYFVNGPTKVASGGYGVCTKEATYALVGTGTPAFGEGWGPKPAEWGLYRYYPGFRILGHSADSLIFATSEPIQTLIGKLDGNLSQGSSATVSIWIGAANSESDSTMDVVAYDWLMKSGATAIASGKKVKLEWINGQWYVTNAECA